MSTLAARLRIWVRAASEIVHHGRPTVAFAFLGGLGDELLCTAPLHEWLQRGARRIWVRTRQPAFFQGFDHRAVILPDDPFYTRLADRLGCGFRWLSYSTYDPQTDRDVPPDRHLIAEMCIRAGLTGQVGLRPHLYLAPAEITRAARWQGNIVIQSSTLVTAIPMPNKQWPAARFQAVVDRLAPQVPFVQLGSQADPPLRGVVNLCGQTSLRESAAVLHHARAFVGPVGFLMHLARAVECPAVIVYGGRERPEITGYPCNLNLTRSPACAPCWQRTRCDHDRVCLEDISAAEVADAVALLLTRPRSPLATDRSTLSAPFAHHEVS